MSDAAAAEAETEDEPKPSSMKPLIFGVVGALVAAGAGFFVAYSGMLGGGDGKKANDGYAAKLTDELDFVPLDTLVVSLGNRARARQLKFTAQLEVEPAAKEEVETLKPRVLDVLNTFLRAVDENELEEPTAMMRLRAQMLRRIQVVTGEGRVKDLLIIEFILN
ncbi:MAG: flagellar basal body-associated FliL family protein [Pseudomonadota bacterium]